MLIIFARAIITSKARTGTLFLSIMILLKFGAHVFTLGYFLKRHRYPNDIAAAILTKRWYSEPEPGPSVTAAAIILLYIPYPGLYLLELVNILNLSWNNLGWYVISLQILWCLGNLTANWQVRFSILFRYFSFICLFCLILGYFWKQQKKI